MVHNILGWSRYIYKNIFVVFKERHEKIPLLKFRHQVVQGLMAQKEILIHSRAHLFQKRQQSEDNRITKNEEKNSCQFRRQDELSWNTLANIYRKYMDDVKSVHSHTNFQLRLFSKCSTCNIFLCCNDKKNCIVEYDDNDCDKI